MTGGDSHYFSEAIHSPLHNSNARQIAISTAEGDCERVWDGGKWLSKDAEVGFL